MQGETHRAVTLACCRSVFPPLFNVYGEMIAGAAMLPDNMEDIHVGRFGTKIAGHRLCALTHFCVPTTGRKFRGYCWSSDGSLWHCIRKFDPRVGDVSCRPGAWVEVVGAVEAPKHPLARLISDLHGKATLDLDNFTFSTAAVMAEWVWASMLKPEPFAPAPSHLRVASVCHWIQDACVPHHSRGWLTKGHASFEKRVNDVWKGADVDGLFHAADKIVSTDGGPYLPRTMVEAAATLSGGLLEHPRPEYQSLVLAVAWTRLFLRRCVLPSL